MGFQLPVGRSGLILLTTLTYIIAVALVFFLWRLTGNVAWVDQFFKVPSALLMVLLSGAQFSISLQICREFSTGEPMLLAWRLIAASALFDLAGTLGIQIFGVKTILNPLSFTPSWSRTLSNEILAVGHVLQGPCRFVLLAVGLACVLHLYRDSGFLGRLRVRDWALVCGFALYCLRELLDLLAALARGKHPGWGEMLLWPLDPMLCLLLAEALLLHRSVQTTGLGLIGRCWRTFSSGIFLILLGDAILWAEAYGYLPWPWNSVGWTIWIPAAAAFALAPAYQLEAIRWASASQPPPE